MRTQSRAAPVSPDLKLLLRSGESLLDVRCRSTEAVGALSNAAHLPIHSPVAIIADAGLIVPLMDIFQHLASGTCHCSRR